MWNEVGASSEVIKNVYVLSFELVKDTLNPDIIKVLIANRFNENIFKLTHLVSDPG